MPGRPIANLEQLLDERCRMVARAYRAGVPVLVGTDAPNNNCFHGPSSHWEMEFLVRGGLRAAEALRAATLLPARVYGLPQGEIAPGASADPRAAREESAGGHTQHALHRMRRPARLGALTPTRSSEPDRGERAGSTSLWSPHHGAQPLEHRRVVLRCHLVQQRPVVDAGVATCSR
jgi:hypothetical protein